MPFKFNALLRAMLAGSAGAQTPAFTVTLDNLVNLTGGGVSNCFIREQTGGGGVVSLKVSTPRLSGVAPLYVNFDASATTRTDITGGTAEEREARNCHETLFTWDFGDPTSGTFANGVQSSGVNSKNYATGPIVGKVFETPGTYVVNVVAQTGNPLHTASRTKVITVLDPNVVYNPSYGAGYETICISSSGNFAGAPAGATQYTTLAGSTDLYANFNLKKGSNKRLLFCKGDNWTCTNKLVFTNFTGMTVGGYGTGGAAAAWGSETLVNVSTSAFNDAVFSFTTGNTDIRVCNFKIASDISTYATALNNDITQVLFSRVEIRGAETGFAAFPGQGNGVLYTFDQHVMYECVVDQVYGYPFTDYALVGGTALSGGTGVFCGFTRGGMMGCYIDNCNKGEQTTRFPMLDRAHINNNYLARPNQTKNIVKIHSRDWNEYPKYSEKIVFSGNVLDGRGGYGYGETLGSGTVTETGDTGIVIGNGGNVARERCRNAIFENNYTYGCRGQPKGLYFISANCPNVTVRNNIADFTLTTVTPTAGAPTAVFAYVITSTLDPTVNVNIFNNTLYCNGNIGNNQFAWLINGGGLVAGVLTDYVAVKNNICYHPNAAFNQTLIVYNADGIVHVDAQNNTANKTTSPGFANNPPVALSDWKPTSGYAIGAGATVPVLRDFNNATRTGATYGAVMP